MARRKTPIRTRRNRKAGHVIALLPNKKKGNGDPWESQIERDFCHYCEFSERVLAYIAQPNPIQISADGQAADTYPKPHI